MPAQNSYETDFARAVQLFQSGKLAEAEQQISRLAATHPVRFEPHHLGGIIAYQSGQAALGISRLRKALEMQPDHAQGLSDLGMMLHAQGARNESERVLVKALSIAPDMAAAHLNLGNVLSDAGKQVRAEKHFREALRLQPRLGAALHNLSRILLSSGKAGESAELARKLIALAPDSALGYSRLAAALDRLGQLDDALDAHQQAVKRDPGNNHARLSYAGSLAGYGRMEAAIAQCRAAIANRPEDVTAIVQLSTLVGFEDEPDLLARINDLWQREDFPEASRAELGFVLGQAAEREKNYSKAFDIMQRANRMMHNNIRYDRSMSAANADDVIGALSADRLMQSAGDGHADATPIFIVGMPRSGTTLTEQILCAHPGVFGAGEPGVMRAVTEDASSRLGVKDLTGLMQVAGRDAVEQIGTDYVRLMRQYSADAVRIIDKVPSNFLFVGLIRLCLPNAKIVHCRRAAADTCLSIFKNKFATGNQLFSYDLDDLAAYYAAYSRVMAHWDEVLPGVVHTVQYEAMVTDQAGQSQQLYAHCGLDWTDDALAFFKTERPVHTASISQVRKPIYDASSGIAGRYGDAAKPLIEALERAGVDPFAL